MALLCILSTTGHFLFIKAFESAEASVLQPFTYLQLVFVSIIGVLIFDEKLEQEVISGIWNSCFCWIIYILERAYKKTIN